MPFVPSVAGVADLALGGGSGRANERAEAPLFSRRLAALSRLRAESSRQPVALDTPSGAPARKKGPQVSQFVDIARNRTSAHNVQGNVWVSLRPILRFAMFESQAAAERSPTTRSRITNGKDLLANVDGRTADARRYRDLAASLADDLGGAAGLTEAQRALVRQAAAMIVQSERLQSAVLRGELVDVEQLTRLANAATRILSRLGMKRERPDATPTIAEIAARHRPAGSVTA
ncbi:MAG: hypothetical protein ABSF67_10340 [Roseiarcus sp.]